MSDSSEVYRGVVVYSAGGGVLKVSHGKTYNKPAPAKAWVTIWRKANSRKFRNGYIERAVTWEKVE